MTTGEFAEETAHRDRATKTGSQMDAGNEAPLDGLLAPRALDAQVIQRRAATGVSKPPIVLLQAQRAYGNRFVQRALASTRPAIVQRKCECGGTCEKCQAQAGDATPPIVAQSPRIVQARTDPRASSAEERVSDEVIPASSVGRPLDERTRAELEPQFNADLGSVRIHTDTSAAAAAENLGADAFTTGSDIYFAEGRYAPGTRDGHQLLAHEVAHTVQQGDGRVPEAAAVSPSGSVVVGAPDDKLEKEADAAASTATGDQPGVVQLSSDTSGHIRRRSAREAVGAAWNATGGRVGGLARSGWQATGGRAVRWAGRKIEETIEWVREWLEANAPTLMEFLRSNPLELLKRRIQTALDEGIGAVVDRIKQHGLFGALTSLIAEGASALASAIGSAAADACSALRSVVEGIIAFQKWQASTAWKLLSAGASAVAGLFSSLWNDLALPAWNAIKKLAGKAWDWIEARAKEFWAFIKPLRDLGAKIWSLAKRAIGFAWDKGSDLYDWIKAKAESAWEQIKTSLQPFMGPLKVIGAILLVLSPLGPILLIGALAYGLYQAARWLYNNWDQIGIVIKARQILRQTIIPAINSAVAAVRGALNAAVTWLGEQAKKLGQMLAQLAEALGVNAFLRLVRSGINWIKGKVDQFATWASGVLKKIADAVAPILTKLRDFFQPILVVLVKLAIVIANPILLPVYISSVVWMMLPECIKPPLAVYLLDIMIAAVRRIPNIGFFGPEWPQIRDGLVRFLTDLRGKEPDALVQALNKFASMVAGPELAAFSNLFQAARQAPGELQGQIEAELLGQDLGTPLPFERRGPESGDGPGMRQVQSAVRDGVIPPEDASLVTQSAFREGDVRVESVPTLAVERELLANLPLRDGSSVTLADNPDPTITRESLREMLLAARNGDGQGSSSEAAGQTAEDLPRPPQHLSVEDQIDWFVAHLPPVPCGQKPSGGEGGRETVSNPAMQVLPPLTRSQRAQFVWEQMKRGIAQWYECNKTVIIASLIAALVVFVVLVVLTDGVLLELLPPILEVVGAIFLGVSMIKLSAFLIDYLVKAASGDVGGAAKSLARAIAIGAIELIFYLLTGGAGKAAKGGKGGAQGTASGLSRTAQAARTGLRGAEEVAETTTKAAGKTTRTFGESLGEAGRRFATNIRNPIGAFTRNGRAFIKGVEASIGRGAKSLKELGERLMKILGFKRFSAEVHRPYIFIYGHFNSGVLLAYIPILGPLAPFLERRPDLIARMEELEAKLIGAAGRPRSLAQLGRSASRLEDDVLRAVVDEMQLIAERSGTRLTNVDELVTFIRQHPEEFARQFEKMLARQAARLEAEGLATGVHQLGTVGTHETGFWREVYERLRARTPPKAGEAAWADQLRASPWPDAFNPSVTVTGPVHLDHIVSMNQISRMSGFAELTEENMRRILNYEHNFIGLSAAANTSKGDRAFHEWIRHRGLGNVDPAFRRWMMGRELLLEDEIATLIQRVLALQQQGMDTPSALRALGLR